MNLLFKAALNSIILAIIMFVIAVVDFNAGEYALAVICSIAGVLNIADSCQLFKLYKDSTISD